MVMLPSVFGLGLPLVDRVRCLGLPRVVPVVVVVVVVAVVGLWGF
jgi:hypothetical protein